MFFTEQSCLVFLVAVSYKHRKATYCFMSLSIEVDAGAQRLLPPSFEEVSQY